jgi:hypothetical protein
MSRIFFVCPSSMLGTRAGEIESFFSSDMVVDIVNTIPDWI